MLNILFMGTAILIATAPILLYLIIIPIKIYYYTKKSVNKLIQKINGQKITTITISIITLFIKKKVEIIKIFLFFK